MDFKSLTFIILGGAAGASFRHIVLQYVPNAHWGVFASNILACFILGSGMAFFSKFGIPNESPIFLALVTGFAGSLSTFSAIVALSHGRIVQGEYASLVIYIGLSVIIGLLCFWVSQRMTQWILGG